MRDLFSQRCSVKIALLVLSFFARVAFAADSPPSTFGSDYFTIEVVKNQPFSTSQKKFSSGAATTMFGFRHILRDKWLMGVHGGFKQLIDKETDTDLNIFTVYQESTYLFRLHHPLYMSVGPKLIYLLPTVGKKIPPEREKSFKREVGAGVTASIHLITSSRFTFSLRLDRWRGIGTEIFQGTETALGINYRLP